ncbi:MAG: DUF1320 family protein [Rhodocyclaceae bacterium]|nr:DUF1320 family protein [Rhodocyclaceae bacterium]
MSYIAAQDMIDRFGETELIQLTDHANAGVIDSTVLQRAIDDASSEIDGYLASVYTLPLPTVPPSVIRMTVDMARYYLFGDRVTQAVADRYKGAITFLRGVADGKVSLGIDSAGQPEPVTGGAQIQASSRVFTRDSLADY